ncbi:serine hydrolase domain-containing protein [Glycomyces rhizosphaerae]|uniref:Serine hydrolase domain-containing protein n=1 Tax=Glycomyces rhizosphaerae TaxID=2054422 RepID=A0ABV7Q7R8_9ACTN
MKRISLILAAALLSAACTVGDDPETDAAGCSADFTSALSQWADAGFSGALAMGDGEGYECRAAFGLADEAGIANTDETVFAIGSISKAFTAAAVLDLVDAGEFALDAQAGALLPELAGPAAEATVQQLLLHTSGLDGGLGDDHQPLERDAAIAKLSGLRSAFEPGTEFFYSNAGYTLLALIVDEATGSYREYLAEEILTVGGERIGGFWDGEPTAPGPRAIGSVDGRPAEQTGDFAGPHWALAGNGDVAMSAAALGAWTRGLFTGEVISPDAVDLLLGSSFDNGDGTREIPGWVSVGPDMFGTPLITASGGGGDTGHNAVAAWLPDTGTSLTVASNTDGLIAGELVDAIGPALIAGEPIPVPEGHAEVDPAELQAREGVYTIESGSAFTVGAAGDGLEVAAEGADAVAAFYDSGEFAAEDVAAHETALLALLNGETEAGRDEREAIEADLGSIEGIELAGTAVEDGELHTYVRISAADGDVLSWYALGEHGDVGAVSYGVEPPAFTLVPMGIGEYRLDDPAGAGEGVQVSFEDDLMTVAGPTAAVEARRGA